MQRINTATDLRNAIMQLEHKQVYERQKLKEQFHLAYNSIKPINLLKSTFKAAAESQELKKNILSTSAGLAAGYLSKMLFEKVSHNPFRKIIGSVLMFGITKIVARNPDKVKALGNKFFKTISRKSGDRVNGVDKEGSNKDF